MGYKWQQTLLWILAKLQDCVQFVLVHPHVDIAILHVMPHLLHQIDASTWMLSLTTCATQLMLSDALLLITCLSWWTIIGMVVVPRVLWVTNTSHMARIMYLEKEDSLTLPTVLDAEIAQVGILNNYLRNIVFILIHSAWSSWASCGTNCMRTRTRSCTGGSECEESEIDEETCTGGDCDPCEFFCLA